MSTALFEHSYYIGNYMSGILYGVELVLYSMTLRHLLRRQKNGSPYKFFLVYSTALLILVTIDISVNAVWAEQMWITFRDAPGGVPMYIVTQGSVWYQALGSSAAVALIFTADGLLIYRLYVIYESRLWVVVIPILMYLAAFVLSIFELVASFKPGGFFFGGKSLNFGTPYYALSISLNIVVTILICYRLRKMSSHIKEVIGKENARPYTDIAAILVESAAPYSIAGIIVLVPYARGDLVSVALAQVWTKLTCISPQWILLRVASGRAWSKETVGRVTGQIEFMPNESNMEHMTFMEGSYVHNSLTQTRGNAAIGLEDDPKDHSASTLAV